MSGVLVDIFASATENVMVWGGAYLGLANFNHHKIQQCLQIVLNGRF